MAWGNRIVSRRALLAVCIAAIFLTTGWIFLSQFEGWLSVLLWIAILLPLCLAVEFYLRPRETVFRSAKSLPRMQVRAPNRGDPERSQPTRPRESFPWKDSRPGRKRRRETDGRY